MPNANISGRFLFYKQLACLHTKADLFYELLFQNKWSQSIQRVSLCIHTSRLLRIGSFETGGTTTAGIHGIIECKTGSVRLIIMKQTLSDRILKGVHSVHVVPGALFCLFVLWCLLWTAVYKKAIWLHMRVERLVLNIHSWHYAFQKG